MRRPSQGLSPIVRRRSLLVSRGRRSIRLSPRSLRASSRSYSPDDVAGWPATSTSTMGHFAACRRTRSWSLTSPACMSMPSRRRPLGVERSLNDSLAEEPRTGLLGRSEVNMVNLHGRDAHCADRSSDSLNVSAPLPVLQAGGFGASVDAFAWEPDPDSSLPKMRLWLISLLGSQQAVKALWAQLVKGDTATLSDPAPAPDSARWRRRVHAPGDSSVRHCQLQAPTTASWCPKWPCSPRSARSFCSWNVAPMTPSPTPLSLPQSPSVFAAASILGRMALGTGTSHWRGTSAGIVRRGELSLQPRRDGTRIGHHRCDSARCADSGRRSSHSARSRCRSAPSIGANYAWHGLSRLPARATTLRRPA